MRKSSELVISNHPDINFTEVEVLVEDVQQTYESLKDNKDVKWIREPFPTESGHVAVMEAPDGVVLVEALVTSRNAGIFTVALEYRL